jgi:hypothetical protein
MRNAMDTNKTTLERAFDLARSGECIGVSDLIRRLNHEGYGGYQIEGPQLKKQLIRLIEEAKNARADRT